MSESPTKPWKYVSRDVDRRGNVRHYFKRRKGSKKIRLYHRLGTKAFEREYERALLSQDEPATPSRIRTKRIKGEWFHAAPELMNFIRGIRVAYSEVLRK